MKKNTFLIWMIIFALSVSAIGCAGLQRKFARKKKEEPKDAPVVTTFDYAKELRVDELYKKHLLFWKTWQGELIDRLDETYKKRIECYEQAVANLMEMKKYLNEEKGKELDPFIAQIQSVDPAIRNIDLSRNEKYKIQQLLEKTKRQIEKKFSYSDVKGSLVFRESN
jgi:hypothetical protein